MTYNYRPLANPDTDIRLIELLPAPPNSQGLDDPLRCTLRHVTLDDKFSTPYAALSYEWGAPDNISSISLDDSVVIVTPNLLEGLRRVRAIFQNANRKSMPIWIDALAINQSDIGERNTQVPRMRDIFGRARAVYCSLSPLTIPPSADSTLREQLSWDTVSTTVDVFMPATISPQHEQLVIRAFKSRPDMLSQTQWTALSLFLTDSYWDRLWIIQEVVLARNECFILAGGRILNLTDVMFVASIIADNEYFFQQKMQHALQALGMGSTSNTWNRILLICSLRHSLQEKPQEWEKRVVTTFSLSQNALCRYPLDKVYGVLGIISPTQANDIRVDYMRTADEVSIEYATFFINYTGSLSLMATPRPDRNPQFPSWTRDLTFSPSYLSILRSFPAAEPKTALPPPHVKENVLWASGYMMDCLDGLSAVLREDDERKHPSTNGGVVQPSEHQDRLSNAPIDAVRQALVCCLCTESEQSGIISSEVFRNQSFFRKSQVGAILDYFFEGNADFQIGAFKIKDLLWDKDLNETEAGFSLSNFHLIAKSIYKMVERTASHRVAVTCKGRLGLVPIDSRKGDAICAIRGLAGLAILRPQNSDWTFVGECFVDGYMDGTVLQETDDSQIKTFSIL